MTYATAFVAGAFFVAGVLGGIGCLLALWCWGLFDQWRNRCRWSRDAKAGCHDDEEET